MILIDVTHLPEWYVKITPRSYHDECRKLFAAMPGCQWNTVDKAYFGPLEGARIVLKKLEELEIAKVRWLNKSVHKDTRVAKKFLKDLRPYQEEGVHFMVDRAEETGSAFCAHEMSLGKTIMALRSAAALHVNRVLVISPAVAITHWQLEAQKWLGVDMSELQTKHSRGLVRWGGWKNVSWDKFRNLSQDRVIDRADVVILDEMHYASNSRAARSKAVLDFVEHSQPYVFALTGTPMPTRPRDLWHQLHVLWPGRFGGFYPFTKRYCDGHDEEIEVLERSVWKCDGSSHLDELRERLKPLMIRRTKAEVADDLPPQQRIVVPVQMDQKALDTLSSYRWLDIGPNSKGLRRMLANVEDHKISAAVELANDLKEGGQKVLVYTLTKNTARRIAKSLRTLYVTGETAASKRKGVLVQAAQNNQCAVATVFSVTEAIDLTVFDAVIFVGPDWMPKTMLQAEARVHRLGKKSLVTIYYLIGLGSIDEVIRSTVIDRLGDLVKIMGTSKSEEAMIADLEESSDDLLGQIVTQMEEQARRGTER